ncbi:2-deoxy-D-gluconate 3-dehydrogenase [Tahibacter aquaticus]|uniref:2-deoxy-D-gluconate 3-dehydrogenase n=1 Tax=Tahibacter aquaticus TaxID=520092 RepID=A0A4R6Z231_9GAMM|nr:SDR family NAD(P)-dependent oxidoreductase [Tahibacter aquaticus]TDR45627.1 2-deoxy-D-gluconate 3-dehydrogenase [Tahibacter aquaticus]
MSLKNKRVVITGVAGGLGRKTAELLVEHGARVVGIDVREPGDAGRVGRFLRCDLTRREELQPTIAQALDFLGGGIDILINNAGTLSLQDAGIRPTTSSRNSVDVNFWAPWTLTAELMPYLLHSHGKVINIASLFAYINAPLIPSYGAGKRAVSAFSDSLRMQYHGQISVTTMYPGFIDTGIHTDAVRQGLSVAKIIDIRPLGLKLLSFEESVESAAHGVLRACRRNYRDVGTTRLGTLSLWFARHMPRFVDAFIRTRVNYLVRRGTLKIELDQPTFP